MKTFMLLRDNDPQILEIYKKANDIWKDTLEKEWTVNGLADRLGSLQHNFEHKMEEFGFDRWEGQEVFVVSGLSFYLDESHEGNQKAEKVREAFEISFCSIEVKGLSKRLSKALYLGD